MSYWLATFCRPDIAEDANQLPFPADWPRIRPELRALLKFDARCVKLYECFASQVDGSCGHLVNTSYVPQSESELTESTLEILLEQLRASVRDGLLGLKASETQTVDGEGSTTRWSPADNSFVIDVSACEYVPTVSVTEFESNAPDFSSLIVESPLAELASLSGGTWTIDHMACARAVGDFPYISIQARNADRKLFNRLAEIGFEERQKVWWKGSIAIQPLSNNSWAAVVPAPSFLPGARRKSL